MTGKWDILVINQTTPAPPYPRRGVPVASDYPKRSAEADPAMINIIPNQITGAHKRSINF